MRLAVLRLTIRDFVEYWQKPDETRAMVERAYVFSKGISSLDRMGEALENVYAEVVRKVGDA